MTTIAELDATVHAAQEAYLAASGVSPQGRARWLGAVADALDAAAEELIRITQEETHLPEGRLRGELARTTFQLRLFGQEIAGGHHLQATIDRADPDWGMGPRPDLRKVNVPLGVVGVFGASNFPFAFSVMGGDSASALAAGCAVVHKIHEAHAQIGARTAEIVASALAGADAPAGLFTAVNGREAGEALVDHPLVKAIGFTGSTRVGRLLYDRAAARPEPIPFYGELGSTNAVFVTEQAWAARREEIISGYAASLTLGMGQFCTNPGVLVLPEPELRGDVVTRLREELAGQPRFPMLTENLAKGFCDAVEQMAGIEGIETLIAGEPGTAPEPSVLATTATRAIARPELLGQEMFGPAGLIVTYAGGEELTALAAVIEGQLTTTVHAEPEEDVHALRDLLAARSGRVVFNGWPTGVVVSYAQQHGGPYPATTDPTTTSVGTAAIGRFMRPVAYQDFPPAQLPPALAEDNPWQIARRVDGAWIAAQ